MHLENAFVKEFYDGKAMKPPHVVGCCSAFLCLKYSYCMFMYLHRASWHYSATLTEVFPCFFLSCKANSRVKPTKTGHGPHSSKILCCSTYCLCVNVYCTIATGWLRNFSEQIYHITSLVRRSRWETCA